MLRFWSSLALGLAVASVSFANGTVQEYVPGEVLVKFKHTSVSPDAIRANRLIGAEVVNELTEIGVSLIRIPDTLSVENAVKYYQSIQGVEFAEPNGIVHATFTPNDPSFASQQYGPQIIQCQPAWDVNQGSSSVIIAIVDTGINMSHVDLSGKIVAGWDFVNNDADASDDHGHGTHCAGISAAKTNNAVGIAGVGFNCWLMPVKVLNSGGSGTWENVAAGINFASTNGAHVISMSLGGSGTSATVQAAVDNAWNNNRLVVAAAGNSGSTSQFYPAAYPNCIAVASTTNTDARSSFSNYGASWVDVAAPGSDIYSTYGSGYTLLSGTSMACPHVAGLGGLLWAHLGTNTNVAVIRQRIEQNCDPVGNFIAWGRINAYRALTGQTIASITALSLNPTTVTAGATSTATVTLSIPAPSGGTLVTLSSNNAAATVPSSITVPEGSNTAQFTVNTHQPASTQICQITGTAGGQNRSANLTVNPAPVITLRDFRLSNYSVLGGSGLYGYVYLQQAAPPGGVIVTITKNGGGLNVIVPTTAFIPAGTNFARIVIATAPVQSVITSDISAVYGSQSIMRTLTVNP
ncbi:MAG TPA: S8 family peptidase [Fimbriimonadaceae bacterium]|nr:S8 family peptidase [Fimbriimonadaceae bacterium]HRJ96645.1 S8 family peptidase [Fimbriimonadaceae bacterium]